MRQLKVVDRQSEAAAEPRECCCRTTAAKSFAGRYATVAGRIVRWLVPSVALALVPKCPACFAMYFALATGVGLTISTAAYLRIIVIVGLTAWLAYVASGPARRWFRSAFLKPHHVATHSVVGR